ncbi:MAG: HEPN domain-containing protein [Methanosarcinales archaeon]|uniref:HEPN domain-containing protein n=1 Tax=Candidatus Ethanoperedens thermophilum TaxID=2766897 RepID=A0A848DBL7_9EURY|nr:HEPN domain-containing protein [Candidatus Ethanoperedens thermophilum]
MSFNWELYIHLADELISYQENADLREAHLRSAISRGYYGIFCIARNHLVAKNTSIPRFDTHKFVREEYQKLPRNVEKKIGKNLRRLSKERNDADYENDADINVSRAKTALDLSKRTLEKLRQIGAV